MDTEKLASPQPILCRLSVKFVIFWRSVEDNFLGKMWVGGKSVNHQKLDFLFSCWHNKCFPVPRLHSTTRTKALQRQNRLQSFSPQTRELRSGLHLFARLDGVTSCFQLVTSVTVLSRLVKSRKYFTNPGSVDLVQKPLRRGRYFFYEGFILDSLVVSGDNTSQEINLVLDHLDRPANVTFASCHGRPAREHSWLCQ